MLDAAALDRMRMNGSEASRMHIATAVRARQCGALRLKQESSCAPDFFEDGSPLAPLMKVGLKRLQAEQKITSDKYLCKAAPAELETRARNPIQPPLTKASELCLLKRIQTFSAAARSAADTSLVPDVSFASLESCSDACRARACSERLKWLTTLGAHFIRDPRPN